MTGADFASSRMVSAETSKEDTADRSKLVGIPYDIENAVTYPNLSRRVLPERAKDSLRHLRFILHRLGTGIYWHVQLHPLWSGFATVGS